MVPPWVDPGVARAYDRDMRARGRSTVVATVLLLAASCTGSTTSPSTSSASPSPTTTSPTPEPEGPLVDVAALGACDPARAARGQTVAFVAAGAAWALDPRDGDVTCLFETADAGPFAWGPLGDRLLLGGGEVFQLGAGAQAVAEGIGTTFGWSKPTGKSLVYVADGATRPTKLPIASDDPFELADLPSGAYQALAYHPSGLAMAVSLYDGAEPQIYLATNEGAREKRVVHGISATSFPSLAFSTEGTELFYLAEHKGGYVQIHRIDLEAADLVDGWRSQAPLKRAGGLFLAGGVNDPLAFTAATGGCATSVAMLGFTDQMRPALDGVDGPTNALGFLDDRTLLVGAGGCGGTPLDLYAVTARGATSLASGVDAGASRAIGTSEAAAPLPEDLLGEIQEFG
jgi:hypothetical protein